MSETTGKETSEELVDKVLSDYRTSVKQKIRDIFPNYFTNLLRTSSDDYKKPFVPRYNVSDFGDDGWDPDSDI